MSTVFSAYRDSVRRSLNQWPELSWLDRFLHTPKPANGDATSAQVFDLIGNRFVASEPHGTAPSFSQALGVEAQDSRLRLVLVGHGESWDVDRDIVDVICSRYSIDPRFVAQHFDYQHIRREKTCPRDLRLALEKVDANYYLNKYTWDLGGDVMFSSSAQLGSFFSLTYETEGLSLAVHNQVQRVTLLLFLRAPRSQLLRTSQVFLNYPNTRATGSVFVELQRPKSLCEHYTRALLELDIPETAERERLIADAILPYITNLAGCCNANYHRCIAPRALKSFDFFRADRESLFKEIQQLVSLQRQIEAFLARSHTDNTESHGNTSQGQEICRILRELIEDLKDISSLHHSEDGTSDSENLAELIQAQLDESREAKKTSVKLGYLNQLAYIFLPLQLTASAMGMNLKNFGTGNIQLRTFLFMLATIATLSFAPLFFRAIFEAPEGSSSRIRQICTIMTYSRRAGFLFAWFCLFHQKRTNNELWESGISYDLEFFKGREKIRLVDGSGWAMKRETISTALTSGVINFFPRYWQRVLDELFDIIDTPQWGRKDMNYHTA
ncbi:MAG: hypothetical protein Q9181_006315 [Wetmoreana brouardii]